MADPRPVRIARRAPDRPSRSRDGEDRRFWDSEGGGSGDYAANVAGSSRAFRMFGLYAVALVAILAVFVAEAATSPSPGISKNAEVYGLLVVFTLVLAAIGGWITVLRAPRGAAFQAEAVLVTDRLGRRRRWPLPPKLRTHVLQRYAGGILMGTPTELIEFSDGEGHRANYLVGRGFFDRLGRSP
ncbi:MAG: hypothetical protein L3J81_06380 [Thermoplasmata archaeon]|jgi:hypothetical protein|nr:hypothetical protein [Thermoplasmata archaeon]